MGKSSKDKRDAYYRQAKESGYRARSAYKLLQLDEAFNLLSFGHDDALPPPYAPDSDGGQQRWPEGRPRRVIDLCAAPGSWSQVLARRLPPGSTIVAVDLQPMTPIPGVITLQADITHPSTLALLQSHLGGRAGEAGEGEYADLVVCDGAPDVTGLHDLDEYVQASLLLSALNLAACVLRPEANGTFVAKIFRGRDADLLFAQLRTLFGRVTCAKPRASRASSIEAFVVCQDYRPPPGFKPSLERPLSLDSSGWGEGEGEGEEGGAGLVPFVACGDLSAFDADATIRLPAVGPDGQRRQSVEPVQPPTMPPYRRAVEMRRQLGGGGGGGNGGSGGSDGGGGEDAMGGRAGVRE